MPNFPFFTYNVTWIQSPQNTLLILWRTQTWSYEGSTDPLSKQNIALQKYIGGWKHYLSSGWVDVTWHSISLLSFFTFLIFNSTYKKTDRPHTYDTRGRTALCVWKLKPRSTMDGWDRQRKKESISHWSLAESDHRLLQISSKVQTCYATLFGLSFFWEILFFF